MSFGVTVKYFQIRSWESHACAQFLLMSDMSPLPPLSFGRKHLLSRFELRPYYGWKPDISDRARFSTGSRQRFGNLQPSALSLARSLLCEPTSASLPGSGREGGGVENVPDAHSKPGGRETTRPDFCLAERGKSELKEGERSGRDGLLPFLRPPSCPPSLSLHSPWLIRVMKLTTVAPHS